MIAFLDGKVEGKGLDEAYLNVGGMGFSVSMSKDSLSKLPRSGESVRVITHLQLNDTTPVLYGFLCEEEADLFKLLITVNGIGPKIALAALSTFSPRDLRSAIAMQDIKAISRIPGIGKKSASRLVLELKDKFGGLAGDEVASIDMMASDSMRVASEALSSMGFTALEIEHALSGADPSLSEGDMLQHALKHLS